MQPLLKILNTIEKTGSFCASAKIPPCFLGLEVNTIGAIALPLIPAQAEQLITQCQQAPFGRGEKTLVDTQVRSTWQLEPEQFKISNPQWQQQLKTIYKKLQTELGVVDEIQGELYKLLIYQTGDFFITHRDTEKLERMFATLVIILPSQHEGGELIIRHDGQEKCFAFGGDESSQTMYYAAFYADCQHEIKPVISGYRLCLIYNLTLAKTNKKLPHAPSYSGIVNQLSDYLTKWSAQDFIDNDSNKLAVLLEHQYSEAELGFENLKGLDRSKVLALMQAAKAAQCRTHLALVTLWEYGSAEGGYDDYYHDNDDYEMEEVFDSNLTVDYWIDNDGNQQILGEMAINETQLITNKAINDREPDEQETEGPTGNAGTSIEYWYHQAALIIWPDKEHFSIISGSGQHYAVPQLEELLKATPVDKSACREFALSIMAHWRFSDYHNAEITSGSQEMLMALKQLAQLDLIIQFFNDILVKDFDGVEGEILCELAQCYGWNNFSKPLLALSKQTELYKIALFNQLLVPLCIDAKTDTEQQQLCMTLASNALNSLQALDHNYAKHKLESLQDAIVSSIVNLFKALYYLKQSVLLNQLANALMKSKSQFDLRLVVIPVIEELQHWLSYQKTDKLIFTEAFLKPCIEQIKAAANLVIPEPSDWQKSDKLACHCIDCQELARFLKDPIKDEYRFSIRQDRRTHLEIEINRQQLDIDCLTNRQGRPHTLVCSKNHASYDRAIKQKAIDNELWQELEGFLMVG